MLWVFQSGLISVFLNFLFVDFACARFSAIWLSRVASSEPVQALLRISLAQNSELLGADDECASEGRFDLVELRSLRQRTLVGEVSIMNYHEPSFNHHL